MSDFDQHNRMFHTQQYRNAAMNIQGMQMDTLEISFDGPVAEDRRKTVEQIVAEFAGDQLVGQYWSRDNLLAVEVRAGYFRPDALQEKLVESDAKVEGIGFYLAGRLDEARPKRDEVSVSEERLKSRPKFLSKPPQ